VRDLILGVEPQDYDIATDARRKDVARLFTKTYSIGAAFGVEVVMLPEGHFEVATFRQDGPYEDGRHPSSVAFVDEERDAERRDFTVNALFYDAVREEVLDYVGGLDDLERGILRTVGDPVLRLNEDRLRLLRAVRFAARFNWPIETATWNAIRLCAPLVMKTSAERIRDELLKMLTEARPRRAMELLAETGLLGHVLPEVARMEGVEQPPEFHPEGDVFLHTLLMLEYMRNPTPTLALGVLLHDVGKPITQTFEDRIRFNYHDKVGAHEARNVCKRLRLSREQTARVVWLVANHMRLAAARRMREGRLQRFVREDGFDELLELARLDCLASHLDLEDIRWIEQYIAALGPAAAARAPLVTGKDLVGMGYVPGPLFTTILRAVDEAHLEGELETRDAALAYVRDRWPLD